MNKFILSDFTPSAAVSDSVVAEATFQLDDRLIPPPKKKMTDVGDCEEGELSADTRGTEVDEEKAVKV